MNLVGPLRSLISSFECNISQPRLRRKITRPDTRPQVANSLLAFFSKMFRTTDSGGKDRQRRKRQKEWIIELLIYAQKQLLFLLNSFSAFWMLLLTTNDIFKYNSDVQNTEKTSELIVIIKTNHLATSHLSSHCWEVN